MSSGHADCHTLDDPWARRACRAAHEYFGADSSIVRTSIRANGGPVTVVGVMPERFAFPYVQQMWLPLRLDPLSLPRGTGQLVEVFGRLRPGVSLDEANAMLGAVFLVLLVACANVTNLLLGRAATRAREVGIRTALGASRRRVIARSGSSASCSALPAILSP